MYEGKLLFDVSSNASPKHYYQTSILGPKPTYMSQNKTCQFPNFVQSPINVPPKFSDKQQSPNPLIDKLPIKRLTPVERQLKIDKGLCYNCDEKWTRNHQCKRKMSLLLLEGEPPADCVLECNTTE